MAEPEEFKWCCMMMRRINVSYKHLLCLLIWGKMPPCSSLISLSALSHSSLPWMHPRLTHLSCSCYLDTMYLYLGACPRASSAKKNYLEPRDYQLHGYNIAPFCCKCTPQDCNFSCTQGEHKIFIHLVQFLYALTWSYYTQSMQRNFREYTLNELHV